jgi:predicted Fe-Mo cluster-binding NifX family protein
MKICITSEKDSLESAVDPRFGRCRYFLVFDTETSEMEFCPNPNVQGLGGVGIQSGQFMAEKGVKTVITGNVGPNAFQTLQAAGIDVVVGVSGNIREVIERYKKGELTPAKDSNAQKKAGLNNPS